ncbi:YidH family protein [Blastococcus sp. SYSU D01042]
MGRWPASVYREGVEPDPRFTFANERTFLAWLRTALALVVAGVAVDVLAESSDVDADGYRPLAVALIVLGLLASGSAFFRWAANERAMRRQEPLPALGLGVVLTGGIAVVAVGLVLLILV